MPRSEAVARIIECDDAPFWFTLLKPIERYEIEVRYNNGDVVGGQ